MGVVDQPLQADVAARHEVRNRDHQVGDVVRARIDLAVAELLAGDLEHFVVDDIAQVERLEDQVQRALERDLLAQVDRDRRVAVDAFLAQAARIEMDVDARQLRQAVHHFAERRVLVVQQHRRLQAAFDFQLALGAALRAVLGALAVFDEVVPVFLVVDQLLAVAATGLTADVFDGVELLPDSCLPCRRPAGDSSSRGE